MYWSAAARSSTTELKHVIDADDVAVVSEVSASVSFVVEVDPCSVSSVFIVLVFCI